jgi:uncharacterized MAPEG superfamily protein
MNIPLVCLAVGYASIFFPKFAVSVAMKNQPEGYNNKNPRDQQAKLEGWGRRAQASHLNGFEAFPGFAAAVLATLVAGPIRPWDNYFAIIYVVARTVYPLIYIANIDKLRSLVWTAGFVATFGLFVQAILKAT